VTGSRHGGSDGHAALALMAATRSPRRADLAVHATEVASLLLGARLESTIDGEHVAVRLTEVEAYGGVGEDPGSHAYRRQTPRNAVMFGPPGHAYVYFTYGMHWCVNIVTCPAGTAGAVLVRAGVVVAGIDVARARRSASSSDRDLARGPARLASALGITGAVDGVDLLSRRSPLRLVLGTPIMPEAIGVSARTGVSGPGARTPWRYFVSDEPSVSPYRKATR